MGVLEEVRNAGQPAIDVNQPLVMPSGVSDLAVGGAYASGAEPELVWLMALCVGALAWAAWRRRMVLARE